MWPGLHQSHLTWPQYSVSGPIRAEYCGQVSPGVQSCGGGAAVGDTPPRYRGPVRCSRVASPGSLHTIYNHMNSQPTRYDEAVGLPVQGEGAAAALPVQVQRVPLAVVNPSQSQLTIWSRDQCLTNPSSPCSRHTDPHRSPAQPQVQVQVTLEQGQGQEVPSLGISSI